MWQRLLEPIDSFLDGISMYRLLFYYLVGLLLAAVGLAAMGNIQYSAVTIAVEAAVLVGACWAINYAFGYIFDAPINPESSLLTGLILALILPPDVHNFGVLFWLAAAGLAMASKYILAINNKHIFNPAAIAVVLTALGPRQDASWWVGTAAMLPFVIIGGLLVMRKVRREHMVLTFLAATTVATALFAAFGGNNVGVDVKNMVLSSAAFFLGFVMLTEPYTSPTTRTKQLWYAVLVGVLLAPHTHIGHYYTSPEIALILGNIYAYIVSPKTKLFPILREKLALTRDTLEFSFIPNGQLAFEPGQYMEWTLPHTGMDARGARRWFTMASSPTEEYLKVGVKFYDNGSSYKEVLRNIDQNSSIVAAQVAGDFVMPKDVGRKLVFIAGGIGVTPFRSMVKYLLDTKQQRDVRMFYAARSEEDLAYKDVFEEARQKLTMSTWYVLSDARTELRDPHSVRGKVDADLVAKAIPDWAECTFYLSGPHPMVEAVRENLAALGVHAHNIKEDYFPGYK